MTRLFNRLKAIITLCRVACQQGRDRGYSDGVDAMKRRRNLYARKPRERKRIVLRPWS